MIKLTVAALTTAALLCAGTVFASEKGEHACCAKSVSNKTACADFANLNLSAAQKMKLETWQADCVKAGCTKESRTTFLKKAQGILSKDQYATLKAQCDKTAADKTTQT